MIRRLMHPYKTAMAPSCIALFIVSGSLHTDAGGHEVVKAAGTLPVTTAARHRTPWRDTREERARGTGK